MNLADAVDVLSASWRLGRQSIYLQGPPGIGKTAIVAQVAYDQGYNLLTLALPTCEAIDIRGIPAIRDGRTQWHSPFPQSGRGILLLDELSSAPPDVQVAAHHLIWHESGSDITIGPDWRIVCTGNRATDRTLYRPLSAPLRNRLMLLSIESSLQTWSTWALQMNIHSEVIGFVRWRPELLSPVEIPLEGAFPSPRAWTRVSTVLDLSIPAAAEREVLIGTIGEGATTEFVAYLGLARQLPSVEQIIKHPRSASIPESPGVLYALTSALSLHTLQGGALVMEYFNRLPAEYGLLYIRDIRTIRANDLRKDEAVKLWIHKHKTLFIDNPI